MRWIIFLILVLGYWPNIASALIRPEALSSSFPSRSETFSPIYLTGRKLSHLIGDEHFTGEMHRGTEGPFCEYLGQTGSRANTCPLRYSTRRYDPETGFYCFGKRYYDPVSKVWLSRDPAREGGGTNLYAYCNDDPVGNVDPFGLLTLQESTDGSSATLTFGENEPLDVNNPLVQYLIHYEASKGRLTYLAEDHTYFDNITFGRGSDFLRQGEIKIDTGVAIASTAVATGGTALGLAQGTLAVARVGGPLLALDYAGTQTASIAYVLGTGDLAIIPGLTYQVGTIGFVAADDYATINTLQEIPTGTVPGTKLTLPPPLPDSSKWIVLHQDQVIMNNYQRYYNDAWLQQVARFNQGKISIPAGLNWKTILGAKTDGAARARLLNFLENSGISEGPGTNVFVNRWLRDPSGSGLYRIPDLLLPRTRTILDGTIGSKDLTSPQIIDFIQYSGGYRVIIVRPTVGPPVR